MPDDDDEDAGASGPPPDPLDRLWFHPSELRSFRGPPAPVPARRRPLHVVVGLAAACAVLAAVGLVVVSGTLDSGDDTGLPAGVDAFSAGGAAHVVAVAGASIVTVQSTRPDGTTTVSGVVIDDDFVLTSAHALEGAAEVTVATPEADAVAAVPVGTDAETDVALLRVDSLSAPPAPPSTSDGIREGDDVMVVGAGTRSKPRWVSVGTIGGLDEFAVTAAGTVVVGLFDTGTSAGRRHSGGAVLDERGGLVGIVTVPGGTSSGLALPIDTARDVAEQLAATGSAAHAWLGVTGADDTERASGGARVERISPASPAEKAGISPGDVIVAVRDGESTTSVSSMTDLMAEVRTRRPGHSLELTVLREGAKRHMSVALSHKTSPYDTDVLLTTTTTLAAAPAS